MKTIKLEIELTYDDEVHHGDDKESKALFFEQVLHGGNNELLLHSNLIGGEIGEVRVLSVEAILSTNKHISGECVAIGDIELIEPVAAILEHQ